MHQEIAIRTFGAPRVLSLGSRETRPPSNGEVTVDVKFSGINFADVQMRLGFYPDAPKRPFVPGYEISGHVAALGAGVSGLSVGDPVIAGTFFGGYASKVTLPAAQVFPLPRSIDLERGAALPVAFFTAQLALMEMGRIRRGDRVLIECATGGVGTIALQMARHVGADVVGLTSSPAKKGFIESFGARALTSGELATSDERDFDFILNASGGRNIARQLDRLGLTGRMVCMGLNSGVKDGKRDFLRMGYAALTTPRLGVLGLMNRNAGVFGLNALHILKDARWVERLTAGLSEAEQMGLQPHVSKIFDACEAPQAHEFLATRKALGKVLLRW